MEIPSMASICQPDSRVSGPRIALTSLRRLASATQSGLRRYPRAILDSVRRPFAGGITRKANPVRLPEMHDIPLGAVWLGHATVLLRMCGVNILVDPVFSERIGVSVGSM